MSRWKVILAAFVIFVAGAVTGGTLVRSYPPAPTQKAQPARQPGPFNGDHRRGYLQRLNKELELTTNQYQQVEQILATSQERMKKLWEPVSPMAKEEYARTRKEILEVLTPEQREKMKNMRRPGERSHERQNRETQSTNGEPQTQLPAGESQKPQEKPQQI